MRCPHGILIHFSDVDECSECRAELESSETADEAKKQTEILRDIQRMMREKGK